MVKVLKIEDLDCAHCAAKIQDAISKLDGVKSASVNFLAEKITVDVEDANSEGIEQKIEKLAKKIEPDCTVVY